MFQNKFVAQEMFCRYLGTIYFGIISQTFSISDFFNIEPIVFAISAVMIHIIVGAV